jgi:hypothetical protein
MTSFINQHPSRSVLYPTQTSEDKVDSINEVNVNVGTDMNKLSLKPLKSAGSKSNSRNGSRLSSRAADSPRQQKLKARNEAGKS